MQGGKVCHTRKVQSQLIFLVTGMGTGRAGVGVVHIEAMVVSQEWEDLVTIVGQDMWLWEPLEKVCSLLFEVQYTESFEYISECRNGAEHLLKMPLCLTPRPHSSPQPLRSYKVDLADTQSRSSLTPSPPPNIGPTAH